MDSRFQDVFDKIKSAAVSVGESAAKGARMAGSKAEELFDGGKIRVKIADKKGDLKLLYLRLGEITYAKHSGESVDEAAEAALYTKIKACKKNIAALEAKLDEMKTAYVCPNCGCKCDKDDEFCAECGAVLNAEAEDESI